MAKPVTAFQVLVRDLPTHRRFEVSGKQAAEWLAGLPMRDALEAPADDANAGGGASELDLYDEGENVHATGRFTGFVTVACSRCVEPTRIDIDDPVVVTFMRGAELVERGTGAAGAAAGAAGIDDAKPAAKTGAASDVDDGLEVEADDLDVFPYDGERVDLEPLFREEIVLSVPYAPLCTPDCKGLCAQCGINRNSATCTCEAPIDPRFAALKGLKV